MDVSLFLELAEELALFRQITLSFVLQNHNSSPEGLGSGRRDRTRKTELALFGVFVWRRTQLLQVRWQTT